MLRNSYCQVSYSLANVINATRKITFVNNFGSVSVFVFVVKEGFDLPCLPQDYKNEIEISELIEFFNKRLTEFFVFTAKRKLDENFLSFFEEKIRNDVVILWRVVQKVVDCMRNKTFRITCIDERSFQSFYVLVKIGRDAFGSVECASDTIPFPLGRDLRFPMCWQFPRFLEDAAIELVGITKGNIEKVVGVSSTVKRMLGWQRFSRSNRASGSSFFFLEKQSSTYRSQNGGLKGRTMSASNFAMKMFARTGDSGLPMPHPSICLYSLPLKLKTVFLVTLQSRRLKSNFELSCGSLLLV